MCTVLIEVTTAHTPVENHADDIPYPVLDLSQDEAPLNAPPELVLMSPRVTVLDLPEPSVLATQLVGPPTVPVLTAPVNTKPEVKEAPACKGFALSEIGHNSC